MPQRPASLMKELKSALNAKDMQSFQLVSSRFPDTKSAIEAAEHLFAYELSQDIISWWMKEECDLPHDPESVMDEAYLGATRIVMERERDGK